MHKQNNSLTSAPSWEDETFSLQHLCLLLLEKWKLELFSQQQAEEDTSVSNTRGSNTKEMLVSLFGNVEVKTRLRQKLAAIFFPEKKNELKHEHEQKDSTPEVS